MKDHHGSRIDSPTNDKVKAWRLLHKRRERDNRGRFLVEGLRELSRAIAAGVRVEAVLVGAEAASEHREVAAEAARAGATRFSLGPQALARVSVRRHPASIIGVAHTPEFSARRLEPAEHHLVLVADGIEKPGNLGAMIRSADGAAASAVLVTDPVADLVNPNTIRSSQGAVFTAPIAATTAAAAVEWLDEAAISVFAASTAAATPLWEVDLSGSVALVIGSEHAGLSAAWNSAQQVAIPMRGAGDSLNASVAAAVLLYEAVRQRR